jgi:hypothetical protein
MMKENSYSTFINNNSKTLAFQNNQRMFGRELTNMNMCESNEEYANKQVTKNNPINFVVLSFDIFHSINFLPINSY